MLEWLAVPVVIFMNSTRQGMHASAYYELNILNWHSRCKHGLGVLAGPLLTGLVCGHVDGKRSVAIYNFDRERANATHTVAKSGISQYPFTRLNDVSRVQRGCCNQRRIRLGDFQRYMSKVGREIALCFAI